MSSALLKKSLEMFKDDLIVEGSKGKKKKKTGDPMSRISTNKKGVKKELQRLKHQDEAARQLKLSKKRVHTAAEDVAAMEERDLTEENIRHIQRLSALSKTNKFITTQVLDSHRGRLAKNNPTEVKKKEEYKSILFDN